MSKDKTSLFHLKHSQLQSCCQLDPLQSEAGMRVGIFPRALRPHVTQGCIYRYVIPIDLRACPQGTSHGLAKSHGNENRKRHLVDF